MQADYISLEISARKGLELSDVLKHMIGHAIGYYVSSELVIPVDPKVEWADHAGDVDFVIRVTLDPDSFDKLRGCLDNLRQDIKLWFRTSPFLYRLCKRRPRYRLTFRKNEE